MKIVIAPDSFKESLSAPDVAEAIARGWRRVFPQAEVLLRPLADGGEGTVDAVLAATAGERRECRVEGPRGEPTLAHWGWLDDATAVIEMASASGLHLVPRDRRDATRSSSRGTGELIRAALDAGARKIILGLGGSATNDAGAGLLGALGVRFLAADGEELAPGGAALAGLHSLD
ncbi:glycerate kinase, partial [Pseudomonas aeruginosa]